MRFILTGEFVPYVRMTQRSMWNKRSQRYLSSQMALKQQFKQQCAEMLPAKTPLAVRICIQSPGEHHHSDCDNQAKALIDAAQGIVFHNDMWIDSLQVRREFGAAYRVEFEVFPI